VVKPNAADRAADRAALAGTLARSPSSHEL
jgi:hypothetical protein